VKITAITNGLILRMTDVPGLDPITAVLLNMGEGRGQLIVECFGCSWAAFWGAMGNVTLQQFIISTDAEYLAECLTRGSAQYVTNRTAGRAQERYVQRIAEAVKEALSFLET